MKTLLSLTFLLASFLGYSQSGQMITGTIVDDENMAIDLALISVQSMSDSAIIKAEYSDIDGAFQLTNILSGDYLLEVRYLGYGNYTQTINVQDEDLDLGTIKLSPAVENLGEVTVTAKVPFIEREIDRVIINPDALISSAGNNALEVLEKAPGVAVQSDGSITLKGRSGVAIYINNKPSYLSGTELESYLRSLPAGSIRRIEIMVNPPARFEAAGNSGVINIVMKRDKRSGLFGNVNVGYRQGRYASSNNSLNLNFNHKKLSLYVNNYTGFYKFYQDLYINRYYLNDQRALTSAFSQNSYNYSDGEYINTKIGADYYLSDRTTFGISYKYNHSPSGRDTDNTAIVSDAQDVKLQWVVADNIQNNDFDHQVYNAYISYNLDTTGSQISMDADYVSYTTGSKQTFKNFIYNQADELDFADQINGDIPSTIDIYAAKTDFTTPMGKAGRFESGLKFAQTKTDNEAIYSTTIGGVTTPDYDLSNRFLYDENIYSAYVNYSTSFGPLQVQTGLRGELTSLEGNQLGNVEKPDTSFTRNYENLFPTVYLSWKVDTSGVHLLSFSYGRRINRPYFMQLNPFISPLDKFTFYSGNPDLLPTFSNNYSLTHTWKNQISTTLEHSKTTDGINETLEIRDEIYYSRPGNIATEESYSLAMSGSFNIKEWYSVNAYAEWGYLKYDSPLYTEQLSSSGDYQYFSLNNSFRLAKGWKFDVGGNFQSDLVYAQLLIKSYGQVNLGVQKSVLDGKGNVKVALDDLFFTRRGDGIINNLRLTDADWNSTRDTRRVSCSFSYKFGQSQTNRKRRNSSGSDSEQRRMSS